MSRREASHGGSWYTDDAERLGSQLDAWMEQSRNEGCASCYSNVRAIIAPHAGYSYSGETAGYAYSAVSTAGIKRVFVLGPSHHVYIDGCALTGTSWYATPLGDIPIDAAMNDTLRQVAPGKFETMTVQTDEDEHSIEMHLPYIHRIMGSSCGYSLVPILVGSLTTASEREYGAILAPFLSDPENLFVVSSDFCHWGARFRFQHYDKSKGEIWESIRFLDRTGMSLIEKQDADGFVAYLKNFRNTICGRHAISVLLRAMEANPSTFSVVFNKYAQSSACRRVSDSSVSYASAVITAVDD